MTVTWEGRHAKLLIMDVQNGKLLVMDVDLLAITHDEFVDAVVENFFEEDVDAVVGRGSVAELADVHPGAHADMLAPIERSDVFLGILGLGHGLRITALN